MGDGRKGLWNKEQTMRHRAFLKALAQFDRRSGGGGVFRHKAAGDGSDDFYIKGGNYFNGTGRMCGCRGVLFDMNKLEIP